VDHAVKTMGQIDFVIHSIAWAPIEDLHGDVVDSSREGFARAVSVSCHSFAEVAKLCAPHMPNGGSMLSMTYLGSGEAVPNYGLMGPVKAALESMVRYMAMELGPRNIRVHAVSPGPILTRAASGIAEFDKLMQTAIDKAPLQRLVTLEEIASCRPFCAPMPRRHDRPDHLCGRRRPRHGLSASPASSAGAAPPLQLTEVSHEHADPHIDEWMENVTYDELSVGQSARLVRTVTLEDIQAFAAVSGDINPAHLNAEYADATMFHGVIAHGMLGAALISALFGTQFPGPGTIYLGQELKFTSRCASATR
jgi:hypothetical protein